MGLTNGGFKSKNSQGYLFPKQQKLTPENYAIRNHSHFHNVSGSSPAAL